MVQARKKTDTPCINASSSEDYSTAYSSCEGCSTAVFATNHHAQTEIDCDTRRVIRASLTANLLLGCLESILLSTDVGLLDPVLNMRRYLRYLAIAALDRITEHLVRRHDTSPNSSGELVILDILAIVMRLSSPNLGTGSIDLHLHNACSRDLGLGWRSARVHPAVWYQAIGDELHGEEDLVLVGQFLGVPKDHGATVVAAVVERSEAQHVAVEDRGADTDGQTLAVFVVACQPTKASGGGAVEVDARLFVLRTSTKGS